MTGVDNKREKRLAIITGGVILGAAVFTFVIRPQLQHHRARLQHLRDLQLKLAKMKADLLARDKIDKMYSQVEPLISSKSSDQQELSALTREVSDLYSNLNVKIRSVKILPISREKFYRRLAVKIEMTGHIRNILQFIFSVERYQYPLRIEKLELAAQEISDNVKATVLITKVITEPEL